MTINKKGLKDKEIQNLIDEKVRYDEWYEKFYLPFYVQTEILKIWLRSLGEVLEKKNLK